MIELKIIHQRECEFFLRKWHYSPIMPKLTKIRLGYYKDKTLVGVMTFGWGTRPLHTIKKLFPQLTTKDYYEIGKMAMDDIMPRNSESKMISLAIKWLKQNSDISYLYTWADGMVGKVGYVYQASNFLYGGFIETDTYITNSGERIHPRTIGGLIKNETNAKVGARPTPSQCIEHDFTRVKGYQFRYIYPLNKKSRKQLQKSTVNWSLDYPKEKDLSWKVKKPSDNAYKQTNILPFSISKDVSFQKNKNKKQKSFFDIWDEAVDD